MPCLSDLKRQVISLQHRPPARIAAVQPPIATEAETCNKIQPNPERDTSSEKPSSDQIKVKLSIRFSIDLRQTYSSALRSSFHLSRVSSLSFTFSLSSRYPTLTRRARRACFSLRMRTFTSLSSLLALSSISVLVASADDSLKPTPVVVERDASLPGHQRRGRAGKFVQRQDPASSSAPPYNTAYYADPTQAAIVAQATNDPFGAAKAADALPFIANNNTGQVLGNNIISSSDSDEGNGYPWTVNVPFVANANANGSPDDGWQALPALDGFTLNRSITISENAIQPVYITANYDPTKIKRAIIVMPGKPRDSWKYTNLVRNALTVQASLFPDWGVTTDSVVVMGPAWLNQADQTAGAVQTNELVFHGTQWQSGGYSRSPALNHSITTYEAIDTLTELLFDKKQFPALNQVVVAGHSMGGQMVERYALLKKTKRFDPNMHFWVGNPGSWAWLNEARPYPNTSCEAPDEWHYGIGGNQTKVTKYARKDVITNKGAVVSRFLSRKVHYFLGLNDNGQGDTHCQAGEQGGNHLDRGSQFIMNIANLNNNQWPSNQTLNYVAGVSHQDYAMLSSNDSLRRLFYDDYNTRYPDLTNTTNPGDELKKVAKPKKFATPTHKIAAYGLLFGSIGGIVLAFAALPFLFPANTNWQQQEQWENDVKSGRL